MEKVSIIIVNWNGMKFLPKCLESCQAIDYPDFEIIVVDNGSWKDKSRAFLFEYQATHKNMIFFDLYMNEGLATAQNKGAKWASGKYLLFLNNDTLVDKNILKALVNHYENFTGVLGCRMGDYDGTRELDSFISVDRFGYPCGRTSTMFYPDGAIFIPYRTFRDVGGFDDKLFLYGEDRDLCWRVWIAGHMCLPCNTAIFYHASSCVSDTNYNRRYMAERNMIRSMLKNYSGWSLCKIIPQYAFLSFLELLFLFMTGRGKSIYKSYLPAYWWNIINLWDTIKERIKVQSTRQVNDKYIRKIMSKKIGKLFVLRKFGIPKFIEKGEK